MADLPDIDEGDKHALLKLFDCEKELRDLQRQVSVFQRDVPLLEDRLQKRWNEANLSAEALKKCLAEKDSLTKKMANLDDDFHKLGITHDVADHKIGKMFREQLSLEDDVKKLKIAIQKSEEELVKCNEKNRSLLEQLSKERADKGSETKHVTMEI